MDTSWWRPSSWRECGSGLASSCYPLLTRSLALLISPPCPPTPRSGKVCAEPLRWVAVAACGHRDVCSVCVARLRLVLNDRRCCICKQEADAVLVTRANGVYTKVVTPASIAGFPALVARGELWHEPVSPLGPRVFPGDRSKGLEHFERRG